MEPLIQNSITELWGKIVTLLTYNPAEPMLFSTGLFLFLFLGFTLIYSILQRSTMPRILFVTAFSYFFYYKSSGMYFIILALVTCFDFIAAHIIHSSRKNFTRKTALWASLLFDLGFLGYFKYANFVLESWADICGNNFHPLDIFLPVGISFFTFQSLSYTIDVYRGKIQPLNNLMDYAFYVSFFPQLVAGPIVRASDFIPQIRQKLNISPEMFGKGTFLIICGLVKKSVISDYISINFVERVFDDPTLYSGIENLLAIYGYAMQIYCDFSGYSDMAIGIALLLGFEFPINFNKPYTSQSVSDFWHRWHISLSGWLRDYLYISLGGNRHGKLRTYINLFLTMLIGGLWHGAAWNFIIWGGMHGTALALHKGLREIMHHTKDYKSRGIRKFFAIILTFHFVCAAWVFFRGSSFETAILMFSRIYHHFSMELTPQIFSGYAYVLALIAAGYVVHFTPQKMKHVFEQTVIRLPLIIQVLLVSATIYIVIQVKSSDIQPFIYFQF